VTNVSTLREAITSVSSSAKGEVQVRRQKLQEGGVFGSTWEHGLTAEEPYGGQTAKGGGIISQGCQENPEEEKGQESYCLGYWVKLVIDVWCFRSGSKLQGRLKSRMGAGF